MPTIPIDILTKQSCLKNKPPSSVRILFSFSNSESMENTEEKKQETINPNYKRKTQEPKLESFVFESTLYTVSFGIFFHFLFSVLQSPLDDCIYRCFMYEQLNFQMLAS